jgi:hypothetical protein
MIPRYSVEMQGGAVMSQHRGGKPAIHRETADKLKTRFEWLQSFTDDELREISYCTAEESMKGDELYFDISQPERGIVQGQEGLRVPDGSCLVPKSEVPRNLWDKLVGPYS